MNMHEIGQRISSLRKQRDMTQLELAAKAGVSRQTIAALEAGKYTPSLELAFRIAAVFKVEIGEVFVVAASSDKC